MKLTKKVIEKKYGVRLERGDFNMSDSYKSWIAYVDTSEDEEEIAWCDTLAEIVEELESKKDEIAEIKADDKRNIEEKLDLINTLFLKIQETKFEGNTCVYVLATADEETKSVFNQCGFSDIEFNRNVEDGMIDLNLIGFNYGEWFDSDEGYLSYKLD